MNYYKYKLKTILKLNFYSIQNYKILNFNKKKWIKFKMLLKLKKINKKFQKFLLIDQHQKLLLKYPTKYNNYFKRSKNFDDFLKNLKIFYFKSFKFKNLVLNNIENQLNIILIRSKFCFNLRYSNKVITNKYLIINNNKITDKKFILKSGDLIIFSTNLINYYNFLIRSFKWPLPFITININYKIKQLIFLQKYNYFYFSYFLPFYLKIKDILVFL